jgi:deazaflavin-dependent oxidoreductase (nitroreductase family)
MPQQVTLGHVKRGESRAPFARLVVWVNDKLLNPPMLIALRLGLAPRAFALLETRGRRSGKPRRTPVGNGLVGDEFWLVAQRGLRAGYVRNLRAHPRVHVKVGRRWYDGQAELLPEDDWSSRLDWIGARLGAMRRRDAKMLRWFIAVRQSEPVVVRIALER